MVLYWIPPWSEFLLGNFQTIEMETNFDSRIWTNSECSITSIILKKCFKTIPKNKGTHVLLESNALSKSNFMNFKIYKIIVYNK